MRAAPIIAQKATMLLMRHLFKISLRSQAWGVTRPCFHSRRWNRASRTPAFDRPRFVTFSTQRGIQRPVPTGLANTTRKLMRHVPHPVAIVTASPQGESGPSTDPRQWRGATVSSFVTVAMDPNPVVCFNIKRDSSTFAALTSSAQFNVHILGSSAMAEGVATKFAAGNALEPFHDGEGDLEWWVEQPKSQKGDHPVIGVEEHGLGGGPDGSNIVLFRLVCTYMQEKTVDIGDHVVVFGTVTGTSKTSGEGKLGSCLLYVNGRYSQAADR